MQLDASSMDPALLESEVGSFAIDSREVQPGGLFFALSQPEYRDNCFNGEFDDATVHVPAAFDAGAVACVVRPDRFEEHNESLKSFRDRLLFTDDAILSFQK